MAVNMMMNTDISVEFGDSHIKLYLMRFALHTPLRFMQGGASGAKK